MSAFADITAIQPNGVDDRNQLIAGARFDEVLASKLPVDPQLFVTAMEWADLKQLQPLWA